MFATKNLPAVQRSTALAQQESRSAVTIVQPGLIPQTVKRGVLEIMLAFPTQGMPDADRRIVMDLYLEAAHGFEPPVIEWTLKYLVFNNPRNTPTYSCPPTPQDVRDACKLTRGRWQRWVAQFFYNGVWANPSTDDVLKKDNSAIMDRFYAAQKGGKPGEPGCIVPFDLCVQYLREEIERQLPDVEKEEKRRAQQYCDALLLTIEDEVLDRMPTAAFPEGALEMIRAKRAARAEAARKAAEHEAYIDSLSSEVRCMRYTVVTSKQWDGKDETEIMAETNRRIELVKTARKEADAERRVFTGYQFEDGTEYYEPRPQKYDWDEHRRWGNLKRKSSAPASH